MSNQLLLRLFNSEYFNSWIAVSYLFRYSDNIGIQHHLCKELRRFPPNEIEFFLPQLCHLLISRPTESVALETFLVDQCQVSSHIAILTFWYLQAYRADLASKPFSRSYRICRRVYNRVRDILFADEQSLEEIRRRQNRLRENTAPALLGISCIMAAVAAPVMLAPAGHMAVVQGRKVRSYRDPAKARAIADATAAAAAAAAASSAASESPNPNGGSRSRSGTSVQVGSGTVSERGSSSGGGAKSEDRRSRHTVAYGDAYFDDDFDDEEDEDDDSDDDQDEDTESNGNDRESVPSGSRNDDLSPRASVSDRESIISQKFLKRLSAVFPTNSPTLEELHRGKAFSFSRFIEKATDSLRVDRHPSQSQRSRHGTISSIPDGNNGAADDASSVNELGDSGIADVGPERRKRLLTSHYFHSEMQFVMALVDISKRLCSAARPARQSSLQAELTLLNHNLPADVCVPLWCPATAGWPHHHQAVRIAIQDCVVLNSAEKVPYLLMVEVLEHDRDELLDTRHPPAGQWESSDQEEEPAWQRSPSLDIDDEDTDELFGGGLYKSRKLKETILLNEQELQRNGAPFYKPDLLRGIDEESSCEESEGTSENRRTPQPVIAAHNLLREQSGCVTPKTGTEQDTFVCDTPEPTDEDRPGLHRSRSAPLPVPMQLSTTTSSGNPNAISTNSSSHHLSADMLPTAMAASHSDSTKHNSSHGLTSSASFSNSSNNNNNSDYFSSMLTRRTSNAGATDEFSERMRTAAVMLAQLAEQSKRDVGGRRSGASKSSSAAAAINKIKLEEIRERIIREMMALEEERMLRVNAEGVPVNGGGSGGEGGGGEMIEDERDLMNVVKKDKDDPSAAVMRESWEMKQARIRASSPFGHHPNWRLLSVIVKTGDDLRQEQLALQLIREMQRIWQQAKVDVWVKYYRILVTSNGSGLMETIKNSVSIHSLKKEGYARNLNRRGLVFTLYDHFIQEYGEPTSEAFRRAQDCFMRSLAGYSVVSYVLQLKDRHNGNVMLDNEGHLIHIDFGFMLSNSPGSVGFEMAPFKLPQEYVDILGGVNSEKFSEFKNLLKKAFLSVRKSIENLVLLIEMMQKDSRLPCLASDATVGTLRERCQPTLNEAQAEEFVDKLIMSSYGNVFTRLYDTYQYYSNGIL